MSEPIRVPLWQLQNWVALVSEAKQSAAIERADVTASALDVLLSDLSEVQRVAEQDAVQDDYLEREFLATRDTPENRARMEQMRSSWSLEFAKRQGR